MSLFRIGGPTKAGPNAGSTYYVEAASPASARLKAKTKHGLKHGWRNAKVERIGAGTTAKMARYKVTLV